MARWQCGVDHGFGHLVNDLDRTRSVAAAVLENFQAGRKVLVLTQRTEHWHAMATELTGQVGILFTLHDRMANLIGVQSLQS